jgi:hypothetical protein
MVSGFAVIMSAAVEAKAFLRRSSKRRSGSMNTSPPKTLM